MAAGMLLGTLAVFSVATLIGQYVPTFAGVVMARIAQRFCAPIRYSRRGSASSLHLPSTWIRVLPSTATSC